MRGNKTKNTAKQHTEKTQNKGRGAGGGGVGHQERAEREKGGGGGVGGTKEEEGQRGVGRRGEWRGGMDWGSPGNGSWGGGRRPPGSRGTPDLEDRRRHSRTSIRVAPRSALTLVSGVVASVPVVAAAGVIHDKPGSPADWSNRLIPIDASPRPAASSTRSAPDG